MASNCRRICFLRILTKDSSIKSSNLLQGITLKHLRQNPLQIRQLSTSIRSFASSKNSEDTTSKISLEKPEEQQQPVEQNFRFQFENYKEDPHIDPNDPTGETEIYRGILATQIKLVKTFSLTTSAIGLAFQPILYFKLQSGEVNNIGLFLGVGAFFSFFTFATPLLIHHIAKKYVTEIRYNRLEDCYTAVTYSLLLRKKEIKFKLKDVNVPDLPGMFTTFKAKGTPLFVDGNQFYVPYHYGKIMGYDKPLDFSKKSSE